MSTEKKPRKGMGEGKEISNSSSDFQSDSTDDDYSWIPWFCSLKGNEFFCEVNIDYIYDRFNLTGLGDQMGYYDQSLGLILDHEPSGRLSDDQKEMIETDAEILYGMIHARYVLTTQGLHSMLEKYRQYHFGRCPRVLCRGQPCLPVGLADTTNQDSVKIYCPSCEDVYKPKSSRYEHVDGAYFGTTFPHLFFLTFPELKFSKTDAKYIPRVFGFRVHKDAYAKSLAARKKAMSKRQHKKLM